MSYRCEKCGKKTNIGHAVSHSNRKTNRPFRPNLVTKRMFVAAEKVFVKMKICTKCLKSYAKS